MTSVNTFPTLKIYRGRGAVRACMCACACEIKKLNLEYNTVHRSSDTAKRYQREGKPVAKMD